MEIRLLTRDLGFTPCRSDVDLWMRKAFDTSIIHATTDYGLSAGECYYEYNLIYVDDIMVVRRQSDQVIQAISKTYKVKKDKNMGLPHGPPYVYLEYQILRYREPEDDSE